LIGPRCAETGRNQGFFGRIQENYSKRTWTRHRKQARKYRCFSENGAYEEKLDIWVFGKQIGAEEIYIKLKIAQVGKEKIAKCLSFHAASLPLCYPYRGEERRDKK
jgi:hypothetical protein